MYKKAAKLLITLTILIGVTMISKASIADTLKISHSSFMPPLSFINDKGQADGFLIDLWKEWSKQSGIAVTFELQEWQKALDATMRGETDINGGLFYSRERAEKLIFGDYLLHLKGGLFAAKELTKTKSIDTDNTICGVITGSYAKKHMNENYLFTPLMLFDSAEEMFMTIAAGRLKLFAVDCPVAAQQMNQFKLEDSFECIQILYARDIYPAVSKSNPKLINTINEYMAAIPKAQKQKLMKKWLNSETEDHWHTNAIAVLLVLSLTILIFTNRLKLIKFIKYLKLRR